MGESVGRSMGRSVGWSIGRSGHDDSCKVATIHLRIVYGRRTRHKNPVSHPFFALSYSSFLVPTLSRLPFSPNPIGRVLVCSTRNEWDSPARNSLPFIDARSSPTGTVAYQRSPSDIQNQTIIGLSKIQVESLNIQLLQCSYPTYYCLDSDILLYIIYCDFQLNVNPRTPMGVGTTPCHFLFYK